MMHNRLTVGCSFSRYKPTERIKSKEVSSFLTFKTLRCKGMLRTYVTNRYTCALLSVHIVSEASHIVNRHHREREVLHISDVL
jgi:hypothetical protein